MSLRPLDYIPIVFAQIRAETHILAGGLRRRGWLRFKLICYSLIHPYLTRRVNDWSSIYETNFKTVHCAIIDQCAQWRSHFAKAQPHKRKIFDQKITFFTFILIAETIDGIQLPLIQSKGCTWLCNPSRSSLPPCFRWLVLRKKNSMQLMISKIYYITCFGS